MLPTSSPSLSSTFSSPFSGSRTRALASSRPTLPRHSTPSLTVDWTASEQIDDRHELRRDALFHSAEGIDAGSSESPPLPRSFPPLSAARSD